MEASARGLINFVADDPDKLRALLKRHGVTPIHCGWSAGLRSSRADFAAALPRYRRGDGLRGGLRVQGRNPRAALPARAGRPDPEEADTLDRIGQIADAAATNGLMIVLEFVGLPYPRCARRIPITISPPRSGCSNGCGRRMLACCWIPITGISPAARWTRSPRCPPGCRSSSISMTRRPAMSRRSTTRCACCPARG